jgi:hypothetical protein
VTSVRECAARSWVRMAHRYRILTWVVHPYQGIGRLPAGPLTRVPTPPASPMKGADQLSPAVSNPMI